MRQVLAAADCEIRDGTPAELNERLRRGDLDVSVIWVMEATLRPEAYRPLPRLAIAWLQIGDEAQRSAPAYPHSPDLGRAWHALTGLPFVFAVWAVRAEVWERAALEVRAVHRALLASKQATRERPVAMLTLARERTGLPPEACRRSLRERLCFDLSPRHREGLRTFLQVRGDAGALASMPRLRFVRTDATGEAP